MNDLSSCCGLVDAKIRASDNDLPVTDHSYLITLSPKIYCHPIQWKFHFYHSSKNPILYEMILL